MIAQFLALSTSLFLPIQGIMARSLAPTSSILMLVVETADAYEAGSAGATLLHQSEVNLPVWMSRQATFFIRRLEGLGGDDARSRERTHMGCWRSSSSCWRYRPHQMVDDRSFTSCRHSK